MARKLIIAAGGAVIVVLVLVGLSQAPKSDTNPKPTAFSLAAAQKELAGSSAALTDLHDQASKILGGGQKAVDAQLTELKGTPVIVNKWASWCGPCRAEFPFLQDASTKYGKKIAFIGLNSGDNQGDAASFLRKFPVPYPSFEDPREKVARKLKAGTAYPITIFFDASGKQVYLHQGGYPSQDKLDADIARYLKATA